MKKSKFTILLLFLVMILAISAVSAADTDDTSDSVMQATDEVAIDEVASADVDDVVSTDNAANVLTTGGKNFTSLKDDIANVQYNTLKLESNYTRVGNEAAIEINKDVTIIIDGNGFTIDGNNNGGIFDVKQGGVLILQNVFLINGNTQQGGAIYNNGNVIIMSDTQFSGNNASLGGAIYNTNTGNVKITGSTLDGNTATYGGAVYNLGKLEVDQRSEFNENTATYKGGAIYSEGVVDVKETAFYRNDILSRMSENRDFYGGAAIYNLDGTLTVDGSYFVENLKNYVDGKVDGAITTLGTTTITDSRFDGNLGYYGSAIMMAPLDNQAKDSTLTIDNCQFYNNVGSTGSAIQAWNGNDANYVVNVLNSYFENNNALSSGALVINRINTTTISGTTFKNNRATNMGAAVYIESSNVDIDDCTFEDNQATNGAAVMVNYGDPAIAQSDYSGDVSIKSSEFINNSATDTGGAIFSTANKLVIDNTTFKENNAPTAGAIWIMPTKKDPISNKISNSEFIGNEATTGNGGAVFYYNPGVTLDITDTNFTNNKAGNTGGAILAHSGNVNIKDANFTGNNATNDGGAIYLRANAVTSVEDSTFNANTATGKGNAIYNLGKLSLSSNDISKTSAEIYSKDGTISPINATVTIDGLVSHIYTATETVTLNATVTDVDGNLINVDNLWFVLGDNVENVTASYVSDGKYSATINPVKNMSYIVSVAFSPDTGVVYNVQTAELLFVRSFTELRKAIDATPAEGTLFLDCEYKYDSVADIAAENAVRYVNGVFINKNLTIDGQGHYIDASAVARAFVVYGFTTVTIKNTVFINGNGDKGKAIYSGGHLTFENCSFINGSDYYNDTTALSSNSVYELTETSRFIVITDEASYNAALANPASPLNRYYYAYNREDPADENGYLVQDSTSFVAGHNWNVSMHSWTVEPHYPAIQVSTAPWIFVNLVGILDEDIVIKYDDEVVKIDHIVGPYSIKMYSVPNTGDDGLGMADYRLQWGTGNPGTKVLDSAEVEVLNANVTGTFADLENKIKNTTAGNTLTLQYNFTYDADIDGVGLKDGIVIDHDVVIDGKGFTICANGTARVFNVTNGVTLTLINVTICHGSADKGAAVYVEAGATLNTDYVNFTDNTATYKGGAIYSEGTVKVNHTTFDANDISNRSSTVNRDFYGGAAIYNLDGTLTVDNSVFKNNIKNYVKGPVIDGAITTLGTATITNSEFRNNTALYGGAIMMAPLDNQAKDSTLTIDNCKFYENVGSTGSVIQAWNGNDANYVVNVLNSYFENNNALSSGALVINRVTTATIKNTTFKNNRAVSMGAAVYIESSNAVIDNCTFEENKAGYGSAVMVNYGNPAIAQSDYSGDVSIKSSKFINNSATQIGGAVYSTANKLVIDNTTFKENKAPTAGAIYINKPARDPISNKISNSEFISNEATGNGGAIFYYNPGVTLDITDNTNFTNNKAGNTGGAIVIADGTLNIKDANFTGNTATNNGSAMFVRANAVTSVEDSTFTNNGASTEYGVYNIGTLSLTNTKVDSLVYSSGKFNTKLNATFLENKTWNASLGDIYVLNATLTDQNGNKIFDPNFNFTVCGVEVDGVPTYDPETGVYKLGYHIATAGLKDVSSAYTATNLVKYDGALNIPIANVTNFTVDVEDTLEGDNATVLITLIGTHDTGLNATVRVYISGVEYTVDVQNGTGMKSVEGLVRGLYPVTAFFDGNSNYNKEINATAFYVKGNSTLTVNDVVANYSDVIEVTIKLTDGNGISLTGIVVIEGEFEVLVQNGTGVWTIDKQPGIGVLNYTAVYNGTNDLFGSQDGFTITINKKEIDPSEVKVVIPKENELGENITVTITSPVDGDYNVTIDGTDKVVTVTVVNGTGSANITGLAAGTYNATVQSADGNYTIKEPVKVGEFYNYITPEFTIDISGTYPNATIKVNGTPGTYHVAIPGFEVANITITGSEVGTANVSDIDSGRYTAIVKLDKAGQYYGMEVEYNFYIDKADTILTPVALTTAKYGDKIEVNISLTDADGNPLTAIVVVNDTYNVLINNGEGVFVIDTQPDVGEYTFAVVSSGDNNYNNNSAEFKVNVTTHVIDPKDVVVDIPNINEYGDNITVTITSPVDGIYNVTVNKTSIVVPVEVVNGKGSVNITGLAPGIYNAIVQLTEKGYSLEPIITDSFENLKTPAFHAEITGTYPNAEIKVFGPAGTYHVYIDGFDEINITVSGYGMPGTKNISNIAAGKYNATVTFDKHGEYYGGANNTVFTVNKAPITIIPVVIGDKVVDSPINITFTLPTDLDPKAVHAFINGVAIPELVVNETTGVYTAVFSGFKVADGYTFAVEVNDTNYDVTCDNVGFIIKKVTPEINITDIGGNVGETVEANVTITGGDATGYILFNGSFYPVENGKATIPVVLSNSGMQGITVIYTGDDKYFNGTANKGFNVGKAASKIVLVEDEINITIGEDVEIIFAVDPSVIADGNVTVWINDDVHTEFIITQSGLYSVKILSEYLSVYGNYTIKVQYNGNVNYNASNVDSLTINVDKINLTNKVEIEGSKIVYGQNGTITVEFGNLANLTGNVTVKLIGDNGIYNASVEGGYATVVISGLGGNKTYYLESVVFSGNKVYHGFTIYDERVTIEVAQAPSVVEIDAIPNPTYPGSLVINYTVINATKINVTVYDGNDKEVLSKEFNASDIYEGNVTLTDLPAGEYRVIVRNIGNDNYATCENDAVFNVLKADSGLTSKASENNTVGGNVTITVSANKDVTGNVSIMIDGEIAVKDLPLVNGTVQFNISGLDAGHHSYLVVYEGDNNYVAASDDNSFDVAKNDLVINSTSLNTTVPNNTTTAIFTLTLPEDATGYMLVEMDGETYFAPLENGTAILIVPSLNAGNYTANVTYTGDDKYASISNVTNVTVPSNLPENAISIPSSSSTYNPTYGVTLPKDATGYIEVDIDGKKYYDVVQNGKASVSVPGLSTGAHNVTVTYSGDEKYTKISKSATVILTEPVVILVGADVKLIYSADGEYKVVVTIDGASAVGKTVTINYNGKDYNVVVDSNGYAILKLDTKVKPKKYTITTTFMGAKTTNKVTVKHVVKAKNAKVKQSKKVNKVKVALKKVDGKYLAGKKITIKFKGKKYKVKTNNKGKAKWKVKRSVLAKLKVGKKYKYTATYGKDKVTKKLKIKK